MPGNWTTHEVEATVADYFDMLDQELRGVPYNKSEHRRRLASMLRSRSDTAIERKHQNISAILIDLGFVYISGYKPLRNYQRLLHEAVAERLEANHSLTFLVAEQVKAPADLPNVEDILAAMVQPPAPSASARRYQGARVKEGPSVRRGVDYIAMEARNRSLGAAGEEFVVQFEKARLVAAGRENLADRIERVSETRGDGLGFDVHSFETSGRDRLIEVKTTAYGPSTPFFVTRNEVRVSNEESEVYHLYRAFEFRRNPRLFVKNGSIDQSFHLEASQFVASIP